MKNYSFIVYLIVVTALMGCKKKDDCPGGSGGNLTIIARTLHHSRPIPGCTLYIKYNSNEFPGDTNSFSVKYKIPNDTVAIAISNLQCGNYYFYATGIDSTLDPSKNIVVGGIPYNTSQKDGVINITVPITERD